MTTKGFSFEVLGTKGKARAGILRTPRGEIETPVFMPVGTVGAVKAMTMADVASGTIDAKIILGNTYHLYLRPGLEVIETHGGVHPFTGWSGPMLTDSGGFQVFSLGGKSKLAKIDDDGVTFQSHIDGSRHRFTPERSMEIQGVLRSDIAMVFDQCPPAESAISGHELAMSRTTAWAKRCLAVERPEGQALFGIVQGGTHVDLRERHLAELTELPFDGLALGGLSVGETPEEMVRVLDAVAHQMPKDKPRYLMGVGTPKDLTAGVAAGIDMFDCVMPTRNARTGSLFTSGGVVNIKNAVHRHDTGPLDPECPCTTCQTTSRSYLRHLFTAKEVGYNHLATLHNLTFYSRHMKRIRDTILAG